MLITVYWEDQRGAQPKCFGPHALLLACIEDDTGRDRWDLGRVVIAVPKKGDTKLKRALESDAPKAYRSGPVVVVFDNDGVRRRFKLAGRACKSEVISAVARLSGAPIEVVLLEDNVEDLLCAAAEAMGEPGFRTKPDPEARDVVCYRLASGGREARDRVRKMVPSFERLVRFVRDHVPEPQDSVSGSASPQS